MKLSKKLNLIADKLAQTDEFTGKSLWQRQVKEEILSVAYLGPVSVFIKALVGLLARDHTKFVWKLDWTVYGVKDSSDYVEYSPTTYKSAEEALKAAKDEFETKHKPEMRLK